MIYFVKLLLLSTLADTGHINYYGYWHCPNVPDAVSVEMWKQEKKAQLVVKRAARQQQMTPAEDDG